jgi:hypothetical protein
VGDVPGVMVHESVHAGEARADPATFSKDYAAEKSIPNHNDKPQEQRANAAQKAYGPEIKKAVKKIGQDRKKDPRREGPKFQKGVDSCTDSPCVDPNKN